MTLKDIFKIIEGREWDYFGFKSDPDFYEKLKEFRLEIKDSRITMYGFDGERFYQEDFSLADLFANQSWCKAVWGEANVCIICTDGKMDSSEKDPLAWEYFSEESFKKLQRESLQEALDYIYKTMNK